ncbi:MAG: roadblock/LC7 domain-containing protein [Thermodesulfobacteriota bacterium]
MSVFRAILTELAERAGATGAIMLDWEGEAVDSFSATDDLELAEIGAHKGIILNMLRDVTSRQDDGGEVESVGISTTGARLAITTIKDGYYLLVTLHRGRPLGRAIFESKKAIAKIKKEMG